MGARRRSSSFRSNGRKDAKAMHRVMIDGGISTPHGAKGSAAVTRKSGRTDPDGQMRGGAVAKRLASRPELIGSGVDRSMLRAKRLAGSSPGVRTPIRDEGGGALKSAASRSLAEQKGQKPASSHGL